MAACARPAPAPQRAEQAPSPVPVAARLVLEPLNVSPDGAARLLVQVRYTAADGRPAHIPAGGHVDVFSSRGDVQWQPRVRFGDPAAIVRLTAAGQLRLRVTSDIPRLPHLLEAATDTRAWRLPAVTARAQGPHLVVVGWFPRVETGVVRITRLASGGARVDFPPVRAPASSMTDATIVPGAQYTYVVRQPAADAISVGVGVPPELPSSSVDVMRGKAMWLAFEDVAGWDVDAMLDRARAAGLRAIELRLCYGEYDEVTPARRAVIDRFIDGAAARGIALVAWTVPRAVTFEDVAAGMAAAGYRTRAGNGMRGIAVDLERGEDFLGTATSGPAALATYVARLRAAVGPHVLIVATVEDPHLEELTPADVPYATIAAAADVLQPMVYWRARRAGASLAGMQTELRASYAALRRLAGPRVAIDIGAQTADLGRFGAPPPAEVAASLRTAQQLGALGAALFDWDGTSAAQWAAIGSVPWALANSRRSERSTRT